MKGAAVLPGGDPTGWPRIVTSVRPMPDATVPPCPHAPTISKPVLDDNGYLGQCVELPDVYRDTGGEARRLVGIAVSSRPTGPPPHRRELAVELLHGLADQLPASALLLRTASGAMLRCGNDTFALGFDRAGVRVALPRWHADPEAIASLRHYAARFNAGAMLCRLELGPDACGFAARLPLDRLAAPAGQSLVTAVLMCCHALRCSVRAVPPLPTLLDPDFRPLLRLARSAAAVVPVPLP